MKKKITFFTVVIILIVIQFFHAPKNENAEISSADITKVTEVPEGVLMILETACYDCHSNNTDYPWYSKIQPVAWWLNRHIVNGKRHLNFSEFGNYDLKKAKHKLVETAEVMEEDEMPLFSYTLIHKNAKLDAMQKQQLIVWAKNTAITYKAN